MSDLPPPMSLSVERRFVWYRLAKTGTRSLTQLLADAVPDYVYLRRRDPIASAYSDFLASAPFSFTLVRNPWSRAWSAWSNKIAVGDRPGEWARASARMVANVAGDDLDLRQRISADFATFVRVLGSSLAFRNNVHFMPQTEILGDAQLDYVGRFERFGEEVRQILDLIGLPFDATRLPHANRSAGSGSYREHFDDETTQIVADLYRADIDRWGYGFEDG